MEEGLFAGSETGVGGGGGVCGVSYLAEICV